MLKRRLGYLLSFRQHHGLFLAPFRIPEPYPPAHEIVNRPGNAKRGGDIHIPRTFCADVWKIGRCANEREHPARSRISRK